MATIDSDQIAKPRRKWRRRIIVGAIAIVVAIFVANWIAEAVKPRPDLALELRIKPGMTESEVADIFGCRPKAQTPYQIAKLLRNPMMGTPKYWYCDAAIVEVWFDSSGRVRVHSHFSYGFSEHPWRTQTREFLLFVGLQGLARLI